MEDPPEVEHEAICHLEVLDSVIGREEEGIQDLGAVC